ncbi:alpha/beta hydrolase [Jiulongibacter sp. NS-SX5]|uniref:alpha/beta hydrolase n=1 Tax=Jiulongibacter sp. NS-SX5 TaxID=3463854 RepID=UPI004058CF3E
MKKLALLMLMIASQIAFTQEVIKLYPSGVPGLKSEISVEEANVSDKDDGVIRLRNITEPTLTVYKPSKEKATGASIIICPGGGYYILAFNKEGTAVAEWFAERGITAFVLKYRLPQAELFSQKEIRPLQDAQQAFRIVRGKAKEFGLDPSQIGIMGFSAGGHLAATASTHFTKQVGEITDKKVSVRPDYSILMYPVVSFNDKYVHHGSRENLIGPELGIDEITHYSNELQVAENTPPTFLIHAFDDPIKVENSLEYVKALRKYDVPAELHLYAEGGHGFGLAQNLEGPVRTWPARLEDWLRSMELIK